MSLHSSLKRSSSAGRHRNVLKREERLAKLADDEKWDQEKDSIYGLPKVRSIKMRVKKKAKKKVEGEEAEAAGAAGVAGAEGAEGVAPAAPAGETK
ncbi:MAG: small basic protein [Planctomycetota bacterium]|jgi:small basic protein (TIGR04137 family)